MCIYVYLHLIVGIESLVLWRECSLHRNIYMYHLYMMAISQVSFLFQLHHYMFYNFLVNYVTVNVRSALCIETYTCITYMTAISQVSFSFQLDLHVHVLQLPSDRSM